MSKHTFNYVRTHRLRHALSEAELAQLIGQRSLAAVSYYESGERLPNLEAAFALQIIFGPVLHDLFPGFFEHVEEIVMRRARHLYTRLEGKTDQRTQAKLKLLEAMPGRRRDNEELT